MVRASQWVVAPAGARSIRASNGTHAAAACSAVGNAWDPVHHSVRKQSIWNVRPLAPTDSRRPRFSNRSTISPVSSRTSRTAACSGASPGRTVPREAPLSGKVPIALESSKGQCGPTDRVNNCHDRRGDEVVLPGRSRVSRPSHEPSARLFVGQKPFKPITRHSGRLLDCSWLLEQVGCPTHDSQLVSAMEMGGRSSVELENLVIGSPHDEQCRAAYGRRPRGGQIRSTSPRHHGADGVSRRPGRPNGCGCAGAGAEVSTWQEADLSLPANPIARLQQSAAQKIDVEDVPAV